MKKFLQLVLTVFAVLFYYESSAQTLMPIPAHAMVGAGTAGAGFFFTAPTAFVIKGLRIPAEAGSGSQYIEVGRINDLVLPLFSATSSNFTSFIRIAGAPNGVIQSVNIPVASGEKIFIVANANGQKSFGSVLPSSNIAGLPITLTWTVFTGDFLSGPMTTYGQSPAATIGRVEMYYSSVSATSATPTSLCAGQSFNVPFTSAVTTVSSNTYTAQLSDANGSFAFPITIGTFSSTALSGNVPATIPLATPAGSGYRIRVNASNPISIGTDNGSDISIATGISASITSQTDVLCYGNNSGSATVTASGGTGTLTYVWSPSGGSLATATGLTAGNYTITVKDINLCSKAVAVTITQPTTGLSATTTKTDAGCFGTSTGTATAIPAGGTGPYSYSWNSSPVQLTATATGLPAGTYTVTVKDASLCTTTTTAVIGQPAAAIAITPSQTNVKCFGAATGIASVSVAGGTTPYTYTWTGSPSAINTATGLIAGSYSVTVKDVNLCSAVQPFTITQPTAISASIATQSNVLCFGNNTGSATVTATGGTGAFTYGWSPSGGSAATATGLAAGNYTVTVTDANLCSKVVPVTITQPATPLSITVASNSPQCEGSSITITSVPLGGTSGYTYLWTGPGSFTAGTQNLIFNPVASTSAGTYNLTLTDSKNCTATATTTIVVNTVPGQPGSISGTTNNCGGTTSAYTIATVPTATSYAWTLPTTPAGWSGASTTTTLNATTPTSPGSGTLSVKAVNGCGSSIAQTLALTVTTPPTTPGVINGATAMCGGLSQFYSISAVAQASSYTWAVPAGWSAPAPSASNNFMTSTPPTTLGSGNGNISITASNFCGTSAAAVLPVVVTNIPAQPAAIIGATLVCGGTAQLYKIAKLTGATSYTWSAPGNGWTSLPGSSADSFLNTLAGTAGVTVSVTAANYCGTSAARTLAVTVTNIPGQTGVIMGPDSICTGTGAQTYTTGTSNEATSYSWTLPPGWAGTSTTPSINGTPGVSSAIGIPVTITVAGVNTCGTGPVTSKSVVVNNPSTPSVTLSSNAPGPVCEGTLITYTATGVNGGAGATYQWKVNGVNSGSATGLNTFSPGPLTNGDVVSVVMKSSLPCATTAGGQALATLPGIVVLPPVMPGININATAPPNLCKDVPVTFYSNVTGSGSTPQYQWYKNGILQGGVTGSTFIVSTLANGDSINAVLVSNAQCRIKDIVSSNKMGVQVSAFSTPVVTITANPGTNIGNGQTVIFTAQVTNAGANPEVRWKHNGLNVAGTTGVNWTTTTLRDGDLISAELVSGAQCATPFIVESKNRLVMHVGTGLSKVGQGSIEIVSLYPNPTSGKFTVMVKGSTEAVVSGKKMVVEVLNANGQKVYRSAVTPNTKDWSVDVRLEEQVADGNYYLRVGEEEKTSEAAVIKFMIRR